MNDEASPVDSEFIILENIYGSAGQPSTLRQRDLAQIAGASLGMTNSILKRLAQKGWITVKRLNSRNIQYAVTLEGINEIIHRSYRYFKRTIKNVVYYKDILEKVIARAARGSIHTVILVGTSDLDFLVEHACERMSVDFVRIPDSDSAGDYPAAFKIYAENIPGAVPMENDLVYNISIEETAETVSQQNSFYLSNLIIKQAAAASEQI